MENQTQKEVTTTKTTEVQEGGGPTKTNRRFLIILILLVIAGGWFGISKYVHAQHHEETDDAQVAANISPVIPRIAGYVSDIRVSDNQRVKKGDTLMILDDRDLKIKLEQAEAALETAKSNLEAARATTRAATANVSTSRAAVSTVDAQIQAAKVNVWRTSQDYERYANLVKDHSITQQQYEQALAAKQNAERQLQVLEQQKNQAAQQTSAVATQSNATGSQISVANSMIRQRQADVDNAKLNLSYAVIIAPADGLVSKINVQPGQFIQAGQGLFSIVLNSNLWVVANFKETQLDKMKEGQKVSVHVDAFPGHDFEARVTSFAGATGASFSVLPPDNASGNFVKVVQRVPVKIEFTDPKDFQINKLRAGMNVTVDVLLD